MLGPGLPPVAPERLAPGEHRLEFIHPDYKPLRRTVTIFDGGTTDIELVLLDWAIRR